MNFYTHILTTLYSTKNQSSKKPSKIFDDSEFSAFVEEFSSELSQLRKDPKSFIPALEERLKQTGEEEVEVKSGVHLKSKKCEELFKEAKEFLESVKPKFNELRIRELLCQHAKESVSDCCCSSNEKSCTCQPQDLGEKSDQFVDNSKHRALFCCCGKFDTAHDMMVDMLIALNDSDKIVRKILFSENFNEFGMGQDSSSKKNCHIFEFAKDVESHQEENDFKPTNQADVEEIKDDRAGLVEKVKRPVRKVLRKADRATTSSGPHRTHGHRHHHTTGTTTGHKVRKAKRKAKRALR